MITDSKPAVITAWFEQNEDGRPNLIWKYTQSFQSKYTLSNKLSIRADRQSHTAQGQPPRVGVGGCFVERQTDADRIQKQLFRSRVSNNFIRRRGEGKEA